MNEVVIRGLAWLFLAAATVVMLVTPVVGGISDELLRTSLVAGSGLVLALLLALLFIGSSAVYTTRSVIPIIFYAFAFFGIIATAFSASVQHSLLGFTLEVGTLGSFGILFIYFLTGRTILTTPVLTERFIRIVELTLLALITVTYGCTLIGTERIVFDVFDTAALATILLLFAVSRFEYTKQKLYAGILGVAASAGILLGNDRAIQWAGLISVCTIVLVKSIHSARAKEHTALPFASIAALIFFLILLIAPAQPITATAQSEDIRPSWDATRVVMSRAIADDPLRALIGSGPQTFSYLWQRYKPEAINRTPLWNHTFQYGVGGVPTLLLTMGLLGGGALLVLIGAVWVSGLRNVLRRDTAAYPVHIGLDALVVSIFGLSLFVFTIPTITVLVLTFLCLGLLTSLSGTHRRIVIDGGLRVALSVGALVSVGIVSFVIITKLFFVLSFEQQALRFNEQQDVSYAIAHIRCAPAYIEHAACHRFLAELHRIALQEAFTADVPTLSEKESSEYSVRMLEHAQQAVATNEADVRNWTVLGNVYTQLAVMGVEDALNKGLESYTEAIRLAPKDPFLLLLQAQLMYYVGNDQGGAQQLVQTSLDLKPDYVPAQDFLRILLGEDVAGE